MDETRLSRCKRPLCRYAIWQKSLKPKIKQANKNANIELISTHYEGLVRKV